MKGFLLGNELHMASSWALFGVSSILIVAATAGLIWSIRSGHFKNLQKVAVNILDEDR